MATSAIAGYSGKILASTAAASTTYTAIGEVRNFTLSVEHAELDATSHDSSGDREVVGGTGSWSGSAEFLHIQANTEQQEAYDVLVARTNITLEFYPTGSSGDGYYSGSGYMTGWELAAPTDDALATSIQFVGTGALTRG